MSVSPISREMDLRRETFFRLLFGDNEGWICLAYAERLKRETFREEYYQYPEQIPDLLDAINRVVVGHNVWYCPQLLKGAKRLKDEVARTPALWSDLDTCSPDDLLIEPTIVVKSSPGRHQALWSLKGEVPPEQAEEYSQRIAYKHAEDGADRSGWDLTQLLRVPFTYNYKYATEPLVWITIANREKYDLVDFDEYYPEVRTFKKADFPLPSEEDIPSDPDQLLQDRRMKINPLIWRLYQTVPEKDWSSALWQLELLLFEAGFSREEVLAITWAAKCNKYERDGRTRELLWDEVCRAWGRYQETSNLLLPKDYVEAPLASDEERKWVEDNPGFVERYVEWARSLGDAAPQYHQAGAFVALSSLLAGSVRLPTSFGILVPNLWFMILADTTLTRKSTAMDITMDLVMEIDPDTILATDGSLEGLLTTLGTRPGRPSVFLRDEFSGLLEMITKKDYYAGMPEMLTKLYDGKMQKRVLRKEIVEVRDPVLIIFAGGIKDRVTTLLSYEQVSSGFIPRFVFITAESDITKVKPLGPPTLVMDNTRAEVLEWLTNLTNHYRVTQTLEIPSGVKLQRMKRWDAQMTPDAWVRYNKLEAQMLEMGLNSNRTEIMTPTYDRLSKSILKAAVLLAASRQREETVTVEEEDIVRAIVYGEGWKLYAREVMMNIGKTTQERQLDLIHKAIVARPGVSRSRVMQTYHLGARETEVIFQTLEQRGLITRQRAGRTEILFPTQPV